MTDIRPAKDRARISAGLSAYHARQRERALVRPRDLRRLVKTGTVSESLLPLLRIAEAEAVELSNALGEPGTISPQKRMLVEDVVSLGILFRALLAAFLQGTGSPEDASRVSGIAGQRRSSLLALGLERFERDVPDLRTYTAQRAADTAQAAPGETIATPSDSDADHAERGHA
jgi:hypothetical protein